MVLQGAQLEAREDRRGGRHGRGIVHRLCRRWSVGVGNGRWLGGRSRLGIVSTCRNADSSYGQPADGFRAVEFRRPHDDHVRTHDLIRNHDLARPSGAARAGRSKPTPSPGPRLGLPLRIISPAASPLQEVGRCIRVEGTGLGQAGYETMVGVRSFNPVRFWVKRTPQPEQTQDHDWIATPLFVGASGDTGKAFDIVAFEVPTGKLSKYVNEQDPDKSYSNEELDADRVVVGHAAPVKRGPDAPCPQ